MAILRKSRQAYFEGKRAFPRPVSELSWVITHNEWFAITETVKIKSTLQSYL